MKYLNVIVILTLTACGSAPKDEPVTDSVVTSPTEVYESRTYNLNSTTVGVDVTGFAVKTIVHLPSTVTVTNGANPAGKTVYLKVNALNCRYLFFSGNIMTFVDCNGNTSKDYTMTNGGTVTLDSTGTGLSINAILNTEELKQ